MTTKNVEYPAKLVMPWHCRVPACTVLFEDDEPVSLDDAGRTFTVHGLCTCSNAVQWCEHWTAWAIAKHTLETCQDESSPGSDANALVLQEQPGEPATELASCQAQRIDLIVAYEAGEVNLLADVRENGRLVQFRLDGDKAVPPTWDMPEVYRWLHEHGYIPDGLNWLGWWEDGLRWQWQSHVLHRVQSGKPATSGLLIASANWT